jgi:uncharacterized membrane protein
MKVVIWLFTALHLLSVVLWLGGMAFLLMVLRPSLNAIEPGARLVLQGNAFRRFFRLIWLVMPITIGTGIILRLLSYQGGTAPLAVTLMQGGGILMAVIFIVTISLPHRRLQAKLKAGQATLADLTPVRGLMLANLAIGGAILIAVASL